MATTGIEWTEAMQHALRRAFRVGKYGAAQRAFPTLTRGQVQSAIRRFVFDFETTHADKRCVITPAEARARLACFDSGRFIEGIAQLIANRRS